MTGASGVLPEHALLAIRYAEALRPAADLVLRPRSGEPDGRIDYFVWLARAGDRIVLIDTGFGARAAAARERTLLRCPGDALRSLGIDPAAITDVAITHLHYDHAGNMALFPNARFHLQIREMAGATGPDMVHAPCRAAFDAEAVKAMVDHVYTGRVRFVDGDDTIAPGIDLHLLGGHTRGLQGVRVHTARGWVMLASDALHFYRNMIEANPFPGFVDLPGMLGAAHQALALAESGDHLIPGHDPLVLTLFAPHPEVADVVLLDRAPLRPTPLGGG